MATRVGAQLSRFPSAFSADSKSLLVPAGNEVRVLNAATGELLGRLRGHEAPVSRVLPHPQNRLQILTASYDGTVKVWDSGDYRCLSTLEGSGRAPILQMAVASSAAGAASDTVYLNVNSKLVLDPSSGNIDRGASKSRAGRVVALNLRTGKSTVCYMSKACTGLAVSPDGKHVASIAGNTLYVWSAAERNAVRHTHKRGLTTVVFHPTEPFLATGDDEGQIILWYRFYPTGQQQQQPPQPPVTSALHWHAHAVSALSYTEDGAYLLSGGEEAVLVVWQLATGHKHFLPRLGPGASIVHLAVSPDGNLYAAACADNALRLVSAVTSKVERKIQGLQLGLALGASHPPSAAPSAPSSSSSSSSAAAPEELLPLPLLQEPASSSSSSSSIVLPAAPGTLQFFDVFADKHAGEVEVAGRNWVSRTDAAPLPETRVQLLALSGDWLVTVERRLMPQSALSPSGGTPALVQTLKIWQATNNNTAGRFALNTRVDTPHRAAVCAVAFHPRLPVFVTASTDGAFKLWQETKRPYDPSVSRPSLQLQKKQQEKERQKKGEKEVKEGEEKEEEEKQQAEESYWSCTATGFYRDYRVRAVAFSADGSLLAVAYGQVVTLWDPSSLTLIHTLVVTPPPEHIRWLSFLPGTSLLVAASPCGVYVWDVLTLSVVWSVRLTVRALATDPHPSRLFAVVADQPKSARQEEEGKEDEKEAGEEGKKRRRAKQPRQLQILLFDGQSPVPLRALPVSDVRLQSDPDLVPKSLPAAFATLAFVHPKTSRPHKSNPSLVYVSTNKDLVRVDNVLGQPAAADAADGPAAGSQAAAAATTALDPSLAQLLGISSGAAGSQQQQDGKKKTKRSRFRARAAQVGDASAGRGLLDAPAYSLPAVPFLLPALLESIVPTRDSTAASSSSASASTDSEEEQTTGVEEDEQDEEMPQAAAAAPAPQQQQQQQQQLSVSAVQWDEKRYAGLVSLFASSSSSSSSSSSGKEEKQDRQHGSPKKKRNAGGNAPPTPLRRSPRLSPKAAPLASAAAALGIEEFSLSAAPVSVAGSANRGSRKRKAAAAAEEEEEEQEEEEEEELKAEATPKRKGSSSRKKRRNADPAYKHESSSEDDSEEEEKELQKSASGKKKRKQQQKAAAGAGAGEEELASPQTKKKGSGRKKRRDADGAYKQEEEESDGDNSDSSDGGAAKSSRKRKRARKA